MDLNIYNLAFKATLCVSIMLSSPPYKSGWTWCQTVMGSVETLPLYAAVLSRLCNTKPRQGCLLTPQWQWLGCSWFIVQSWSSFSTATFLPSSQYNRLDEEPKEDPILSKALQKWFDSRLFDLLWLFVQMAGWSAGLDATCRLLNDAACYVSFYIGPILLVLQYKRMLFLIDLGRSSTKICSRTKLVQTCVYLTSGFWSRAYL